MKRFLIPIIVFFALPFSSVESVEINCNSPVWKNKPACKGKSTYKITYIYNRKKFDSLSSIANSYPNSDIYSRDIFAKRNKRYVASRNCPTETNMYWVSRGFFGKYSEMGCMTPDQFEFAKFQLTRGRGGGGGSYNANQYNDSYNRQLNNYRRIDNFNNTGSFDQPTFNFNTNTGGD